MLSINRRNNDAKDNRLLEPQKTQEEVMFLNLQILITDTGIGISKEAKRKLFIDFSKLNNTERNKEGTGLGLSICKNIIEKMGGSVEVESQLGKGTSFIINLKT